MGGSLGGHVGSAAFGSEVLVTILSHWHLRSSTSLPPTSALLSWCSQPFSREASVFSPFCSRFCCPRLDALVYSRFRPRCPLPVAFALFGVGLQVCVVECRVCVYLLQILVPCRSFVFRLLPSAPLSQLGLARLSSPLCAPRRSLYLLRWCADAFRL